MHGLTCLYATRIPAKGSQGSRESVPSRASPYRTSARSPTVIRFIHFPKPLALHCFSEFHFRLRPEVCIPVSLTLDFQWIPICRFLASVDSDWIFDQPKIVLQLGWWWRWGGGEAGTTSEVLRTSQMLSSNKIPSISFIESAVITQLMSVRL